MKGAKLLADKLHMMSVGEVELLQEICEGILPPDAHVINIGAGVGTSLLAVQEVLPEATIFSIDKVLASEAFVNMKTYGGDPSKIIKIVQDSAKVGQIFPYSVDMVFVDGAHDIPAVEKDIFYWKPLVRSLGVMFFHDYEHPNLPELSPVVNAMMDDWYRLGKDRYLVAFQR